MTNDSTAHMPILVPVILCGGSGARLWPMSRESYPKQFLALTGGLSMLQDTALRLKGLSFSVPVASSPVVVCNVEHRFVTGEQLASAGVTQARIVLEPVGRNTAPALTLAALIAQSAASATEDPVLLAMPADHIVTNSAGFRQAVEKAFAVAAAGAMVTFGVVPDRPETGYGYIELGPAQAGETFAVASFTEKPNAVTAQAYIDTGKFLWNSGLFMVKASQWLKAIAHSQPDILAGCQAAMDGATLDYDFIRPQAEAFIACPSDSIDYAVMEKLPAQPQIGVPARVIPLDAGWSDLGAWDSLWQTLPRDSRGNATVGDAFIEDSTDCLLLANSRMVAGVGLEHTIVIETPDAVLVIDKRKTQDVRKVVTRLKAENHTVANNHRKTHRPWGWYDCLDSGERFQVKRIVVNPGAELSLQMHNHRAEHWIVVKGTAQVTNGDHVFLLRENESTFISLGRIHRLANPENVPLEIIEVQSGLYLGEDDIVRFDDAYGRRALVS